MKPNVATADGVKPPPTADLGSLAYSDALSDEMTRVFRHVTRKAEIEDVLAIGYFDAAALEHGLRPWDEIWITAGANPLTARKVIVRVTRMPNKGQRAIGTKPVVVEKHVRFVGLVGWKPTEIQTEARASTTQAA